MQKKLFSHSDFLFVYYFVSLSEKWSFFFYNFWHIYYFPTTATFRCVSFICAVPSWKTDRGFTVCIQHWQKVIREEIYWLKSNFCCNFISEHFFFCSHVVSVSIESLIFCVLVCNIFMMMRWCFVSAVLLFGSVLCVSGNNQTSGTYFQKLFIHPLL